MPFSSNLSQTSVLFNFLIFANQEKVVSSYFSFSFLCQWNINMFLYTFVYYNSKNILSKESYAEKLSYVKEGNIEVTEIWSCIGKFVWGGHGNSLQYSCLEYPQGQRSLAGYCPWSHKRVRQNLVTKQRR